MWDRTLNSFNKGYHWLKKEEEGAREQNGTRHGLGEDREANDGQELARRRAQSNVIPMLPKAFTFKRQNSEMRDRLMPHEPSPAERRAHSTDRRVIPGHNHDISPPPLPPYASAPHIIPAPETTSHLVLDDTEVSPNANQTDNQYAEDDQSISLGSIHQALESVADSLEDPVFQAELELRWILNLSMHFRDMSDREKFFITYAAEPNRWLRVTVSLDYRNLDSLPNDSLEADLKSLHYQRDKSARIYEAVRDSLSDIKWYDTVTNLKLQTQDGRLHVHVTEDVYENIQYPAASVIGHLECPHIPESDVEFDSHISGFVYRVRVNGYPSHNDASISPPVDNLFIKKEIPGPDAVEEFLYEINALASLRHSHHVVHFDGIIVSHDSQSPNADSAPAETPKIKGLLLRYASKGALIDILYDNRIIPSPTQAHHPSPTSTGALADMDGTLLPLDLRLRWAYQILVGLQDIHAAGFVQGDFTLSNIVLDSENNARIIDINRRGCPVGWEPPELASIIKSGGRVAMYIGVKSDLFQAGMVLWGLGEGWDEPERVERPLTDRWGCKGGDAPGWFRDLTAMCLSERPHDRLPAEELVRRFEQHWSPPSVVDPQAGSEAVLLGSRSKSLSIDECEWPSEMKKESPSKSPARSPSPHRPEKEYIDPSLAISLDDIRVFNEEKARRGIPYERLPSEPEIEPDQQYPNAPMDPHERSRWIESPPDVQPCQPHGLQAVGSDNKPKLDLEGIQDLTCGLHLPHVDDPLPSEFDNDFLAPHSAPPPTLTTGTGTEAETSPERSPEVNHIDYSPNDGDNETLNLDDSIMTPRRETRGKRKEVGNDPDRDRDREHSERWETIYVDGNQRLVSRGSGIMAAKESQHDIPLGLAGSPRNRPVAIEEQDESVTPPGLIPPADLSNHGSRPGSHPSSPGNLRPSLPERRATFQERMAQLNLRDAKGLEGWENQMMRREDVGGMSLFGPPPHKDSGFEDDGGGGGGGGGAVGGGRGVVSGGLDGRSEQPNGAELSA